MADAHPQVDRLRFGLSDIFAIVAAFAMALAVVRALFDAGLIRVASQTSLVPRAEPSFEDLPLHFAALTALVGLTFCQPIIIAAQYLMRRRNGRPSIRETIGLIPGVSLLIAFASIALDQYFLHVWRAYFEFALIITMVMLCGNTFAAVACLRTTSRASWQWTDWLGCATAITIGLFQCFSIFGA